MATPKNIATSSGRAFPQKKNNLPQFENYLVSLVQSYENAGEIDPYLKYLQTIKRDIMNKCERCGRFCRNTIAVSRGNGSYDPLWVGPCCTPNRHEN